jgi:hypothetical protein
MLKGTYLKQKEGLAKKKESITFVFRTTIAWRATRR